jgi:fucose 4-O-acetylase-like acetyltransferase
MESKHFDWIDIAKGIGIVLVVLGHTLVPQIRNESSVAGFLWIFIYNFHMPLFFFLSGFLFEKGLSRYNDKLKFIQNKAHFLLVPYLFFSIFAYLFINCALNIDKLARVLEGGGYEKTKILQSILSILTYNNHLDKHLWFLFSLFIVFLINILMPKLTKHPIAIVIMLGLYVSKAFVTYFGILDYVVSDFFFFAVGRLVISNHSVRDIFKRSNTVAAIVMFLLMNSFYSYLYVRGLPDNKIFIAVLYCFRACVSLLGIISVCKISIIIEKSKLADLFKKLGGYSYDIYLMHAPFLVSGSMGILLAYSPLPEAFCCVIVLFIGIILPIAISKFIVRRVPIFSAIILGTPFKRKIKNSQSYIEK